MTIISTHRRNVSCSAKGTTNWYCRNPFGPYTRFHSATMSSGWKKVVMFCTSPTRCLGALRNHIALNALAVARLTIRLGKTSGMVPNEGAANRSGSVRSLAGRSASLALLPRVSTARPRCLPRVTASNQATE